ncbi:MAG: ComF family protein [Gammaproteobacteria bacterium]|nr:ComF family protein [Gammaproteobacteria bacterium]
MSIRRWLAAELEWFQHLLLPPTCLLCGAAGAADRDLCAGCTADLPRNVLACAICALPLPMGQASPCRDCRLQPPDYDRAFAPFCYRPPIDFLMRRLKFNGRLSHARLLGELFADTLIERGGPWPDCIVPVPLHPLRLRERGFNQSLELAHPAVRRLHIPLQAEGLQRIRYTTPQIQLDARARQVNPRGAFVLDRLLPGARVALIDDVMTTGSTVSECARVLRAGGATDIEVWVIARASGEF